MSLMSKNSFHSRGVNGDGPVLGIDPNSEGLPVKLDVGGATAEPADGLLNVLICGAGGGKLFD